MAAEIALTAKALKDSPTSDRNASRGIPGGFVHKEGLRQLWMPAARPSPTVDRSGLAGNYSGQSTYLTGQGNGTTLNGGVEIMPPSARSIPAPSLHPLQEWEGYVIDIDEHAFGARLLDLTAGDVVEQEEATIPLEEISLDDRSGIAIGAMFRWVIGYERSVSGIRKRVSQIVFLDSPPMTEQDLERGSEWADRLREKWDLD